MFENLSDRLQNVMHKIKGYGRITEDNISDMMREIRLSLLEADVNYKTAKTFTDNVKAKALGQNVLTAVRPGQLLIKITHDELAELMGGEAEPINLKGNPAIVLLSGLQGSGKTTHAAKLAKLLKKEGWTVFGTIIESQSPKDLEKLGITPIVVDIADPESTENAKRIVEEALGEEGLSALINVAGLPVGGLLEGWQDKF